MEEVNIILTTPEAMLFRDFQQFHSTFALLASRGVFDIRNGSVTLHFDSDGIIRAIDRKDSLYSSKHEVM